MITNLSYIFIHPTEISIRWDYTSTDYPLVKFKVMVSGSGSGDFETIEETANPFIVTEINLYSKFKNIYIKIVVSDGFKDIEESNVINMFTRPDRISIDRMKQERFKLEKGSGSPSFLLIRKKFGQKCKTCTPPVGHGMGSVTNNCIQCYGTGFIGGYYSPIQFYYSNKSATNAQEIKAPDTREEEQMGCWTTASYGILYPDDIIMDYELPNKIWIVNAGVQKTERDKIPLQFHFTLTEVDRSHIIYKYPTPSITFKPKNKVYFSFKA